MIVSPCVFFSAGVFMDDKWLNFWNTGSVEDYLDYKMNEKVLKDENNDKGISNQRADDRGE